ncbi:hypothetical protein EDD85DRAFT_947485 [Armillaria nabsnona]|nr:hypothetical protein EDD85DRAFT_947485 [Armillaria nabsnona]
MSPDLTPIQTITIGITIAVVTLIITVFLLTLTFVHELRHLLEQIGILRAARFPRTNFDTTPFPRHYVEPRMAVQPLRVRTTRTATVTLVRHALSEDVFRDITEIPTNREDLLRNATPGPSNTRRTPTPEPEPIPNQRLWVTNPDDPDYPAGVWSNATEHKRFRNWDQPVVVLDSPYEPDSFDPVPPYFVPQALLTNRSRRTEFNTSFRTGLPERQGDIPFPVSGGIRLQQPARPPNPWPKTDSDMDSGSEPESEIR